MTRNGRVYPSVFLSVVLALFLIPAFSEPGQPDTSAVVFGVSWYDVGKSGLGGLPGMLKVTSGWRGSMEVNTVEYDASRITIEQMEYALKKAGTYRKTVNEE